ncbi:HTTM domain-containing protein [Streptosporangium sp. NPDC002524]|uniref:HTTM domain-containing protein n=1 Tax=Streptosporangium sp. NPDC002524 TaxID=3154537 RepID=UPI0033165768
MIKLMGIAATDARQWTSARARTGFRAISTRAFGRTGLSLLRIVYGSVILGMLLVNYGVRDEVWGPSGLFLWDEFVRQLGDNRSFSLYALSNSVVASEVIYHALIVVALLFVLGWRTRVVTPLLWLLVWSWYERNPYVMDGGDNLLRIVLVYLIFADVSARFSLDARRKARRSPARARTEIREIRGAVASVFHNAALAATVFQISVVYLAAGMYKVQGERWQEGTALYYILRVAEYTPWPELSRLVYENGLLVTVMTYVTVFFQVAFPLLLLNRVTRLLGFMSAFGMHLGIAVLMGLPFFSLIMLATDLVLISDREYGTVRRAWASVRDRTRMPSVGLPAVEVRP